MREDDCADLELLSLLRRQHRSTTRERWTRNRTHETPRPWPPLLKGACPHPCGLDIPPGVDEGEGQVPNRCRCQMHANQTHMRHSNQLFSISADAKNDRSMCHERKCKPQHSNRAGFNGDWFYGRVHDGRWFQLNGLSVVCAVVG